MAKQSKVLTVDLTMNQVVAYNLRRARTLRGWTQEDAAERLSPFLGLLWSRATFSAAERSFESPERVRQFTADDILALSRTFDLPIPWFFLPPPITDTAWRRPDVAGLTPPQVLERLFDVNAIGERLQEAINDGEVLGTTDYLDRVRKVARFASQITLAAVKQEMGDIARWKATLSELIERLGAAEEAAEEAVTHHVSTPPSPPKKVKR